MREMGTVRGIDMRRGGGRNRMCVDDVGHGGVQVGASLSSLKMGVLKYMTMPLRAWAWCSKAATLVLWREWRKVFPRALQCSSFSFLSSVWAKAV
jgi:hypothetical protein